MYLMRIDENRSVRITWMEMCQNISTLSWLIVVYLNVLGMQREIAVAVCETKAQSCLQIVILKQISVSGTRSHWPCSFLSWPSWCSQSHGNNFHMALVVDYYVFTVFSVLFDDASFAYDSCVLCGLQAAILFASSLICLRHLALDWFISCTERLTELPYSSL